MITPSGLETFLLPSADLVSVSEYDNEMFLLKDRTWTYITIHAMDIANWSPNRINIHDSGLFWNPSCSWSSYSVTTAYIRNQCFSQYVLCKIGNNYSPLLVKSEDGTLILGMSVINELHHNRLLPTKVKGLLWNIYSVKRDNNHENIYQTLQN